MKYPSDLFSILLAVCIALNTVLCMISIVTENHTMAITNFLSGVCLLFTYENRRRKND